ncbi:uncharacterized protein LOC110178339 isoform X1 [Drosophila serrata]|uniref:uncharacterized protein LOC110178339 isoform X1 n=2 Tax=Drosophila serrata TaxID=7274 RepID=UPI000A1D06D2|nr:uncharacterized protein LOC110178339 isoform X1 [Drosophila serrata]
MYVHSLLVRDKRIHNKDSEDLENMTKNKNQKKKAAAAAVAKKMNNNNNPPDGTLTPPGTPPSSNEVGTKTTTGPGTYPNGMARKTPVPWEREFIGTFLLEMADRQVITARSEWYVDKTKMRQMFEAHLASQSKSGEVRLKLSIQGAWNIGSLLHRTNFLINTPRGNNNYRIKNFALMEFRKEKFNLMDENHRQRDVSASTLTTISEGAGVKGNGGVITEEYKLDSKAQATILKYQKTQVQMPPTDFKLGSMGCYICQVNFETIEKYEEHVEYHGDESDFKSLKNMEKLSSPKLTLSYQTCLDSHYFGFTLKTEIKDLVINKFIIVQLRQFYYVNNARMPLEVSEKGELVFFVDSHVFMILREMPIVIGFTCNGVRYVEQHHFMRTEALPKASFNINPYRLSSNETFKSQRLAPANPPTEVVHALKHDDAQVRLADFDKHYRNFCERGKDLTQENITGTLRTLLQVEDIERLQHYLALKQSKMELHQFGRELSVKLQQSANSMSVEDIVSPGDDVLIINERSSSEGGVRQLLESNNQVLELALKDFDAIVQWGRMVDERFGSLDKPPRVYFARILGVSTQRVNITCERQLADNTTYTLIFRPMRAVMRYQYRALQQLALTRAEDVQRILFPGDIPRESVPVGAIKLNNGRIASNPEQMDAVKQIAFCKKLPAPYIVFGPPGTGKTSTICEAIYQLYVNRPETNILVLAGSNTACDEVALRLLQAIAKAPESQPRPLARIFAASCDRRIDNIDDLLLEYSNMYAVHFYPAVQALHQYRIVVCTLSLAGKLSTGGFARGDIFSHVFLDEAAASTEAEALMGITCTISPSSNLILSGDHKQLGPVLQSQRASEWGLDVSLFERLLERKCYQVDKDGSYNKAIQTRLIRNFRSHPEIVSLYSELYYNGKLKAQAPMDAVCRFQTWFHTPNADFPIMFHSVFGTVMNTKSSVSLCNNKEIDAVMDYVKDLMYFGLNGEKVSQSDIGVISPYKSQYQRIQEQLNMRNWSQIDCGSVELFQGKEKQVVIVSFVRSFTPKLGFLNNQRRLNVLLSRPMSLLILIGNPRTLSQNNDFRRIIEMCRDRKTLVGMPYFHEEVNFQNKPNPVPGGARSGAAGAAVERQQQAATPAGLGQTLKRTASNTKNPAQAVRLFYNKEQLLKLGNESKTADKTELDKIFDELPKVPGQGPRYVNHNCDATRAVTAQLKDLKLGKQGQEKGSTTQTPSKHPKPLNLPVNTPFRLPSDENTPNNIMPVSACRGEPKSTVEKASKPISIKAMPSIRSEQRYINGVPCGIEVPYQPSAPQMSPPKTTYSYIPSENHRFENMRPMSEEYRRPPPYYEHHGNWTQIDWPPTPPPRAEKKSKCVIS